MGDCGAEGRETELQALFDDYYQHKDEVVVLSPDGFHGPAGAFDRQASQGAIPRVCAIWPCEGPGSTAEFDDSAGMHSFSQVYFNPSHTLAMVYFGVYSGGLCGQSSWVVLERLDGRWGQLRWVRTFMIS